MRASLTRRVLALPWSRPVYNFAIAASLALGVLACSPGEPPVVYEYEQYEGDAYPNHRKPLEIPAGGAAFVTNSYSDSISVVAVATGDVLGTYPVGRDPVSLDGPHHVTVSPSGDAVYLALSYPIIAAAGPHATHGSSTRSGYAQKLDASDMHVVGQVRVDNNPGEIVLSEDGKRLVTSHFDLKRALENPTDIDAARATIAVIDPSQMLMTGSPAARRITTCVAPHGMVLSRPDGATGYVACYGEDVVTIVDLEKGEVTARVPMGPNAEGFGNPVYGPYSMTLSPTGALVAVGNTVSKDVRFLDTKTGAIKTDLTLPLLGAPYFVAFSPDEKQVLVPLQAPDAAILIDLATKTEVAHRDFTGDDCPLPHVAIRSDNEFLLVCEGDHKGAGKILWLDPTTLDTTRSADVGVYPDAITMFAKEAP